MSDTYNDGWSEGYAEGISEVEDLRRENADLRTYVDTHAALSAQLAAAQAQLAEFDRECYERSLEQQTAEARLEAVLALCRAIRQAGPPPWRIDLRDVDAALSATPQPEPEQ